MLRPHIATATLFGLGLCSWTAGALLLSGAEILGHDEARYAISASDWITGHAIRWNYVPYGMNLIAAPGVAAGGGPHASRAVSIVLGIGFVLAAAHLARRVASARTAAWLVATLAGTASLVKRSAELLSDLPAALCLLVAITLLVDELDRTGGTAPRLASLDRDAGPRWRVVWVAPLLAAAFYVRYGTCIPIAMIGVAVAAVGWRTIAARPAPAIATVALLAVLLVPHIAMSIRLTGSPLGIVRESSTLIGSGFAASLVTYTTSNPFTYFGLTAPVLVAGVLSIVRIRDRRRGLLWAIAILDVVVLGLVPMAAVRYLVVGLALLALLGIDAIERAIALRTPRLRAWVAALAVVALVAAWVETDLAAYRLASTARTRAARTVLAADAIRRDAAGAPCEVIGRHSTQLQWYSGCEAVFATTADEIRHARIYVVIEPHSDHEPKLGSLPSAKRTAIVDRSDVTVTRMDPP
jgi:hypothetical protein